MKKKVSELTPNEFMQTFPLFLLNHNPNYKAWFEIEKLNILNAVNNKDVVRINHIGSTAIENLIAKPIIDILLEVDGSCDIRKLLDDLKTIDFGNEISTRRDNPMRLLLSKGMSCDGYAEKAYLLHVRYFGDWDELYFRDYLLAHPEVAMKYGRLKQNILRDIENGIIERMPNGNPNGYSQAKLSFVEEINNIAKHEFCDKYKPKL